MVVFAAIQLLGIVFVVGAWAASVAWTARDSGRRCRDHRTRRAAVATAVVFPFAGAALYALARPCEEKLDARERRLRMRLLDTTLLDPGERCLVCLSPLEPDFRCCPGCGERLRRECGGCGELIEVGWLACPWCAQPGLEPARSVA